MKIHFVLVEPKVPDENSITALKIRIRELLLRTGIDENDNSYGRIMERISLLESDDINLLHSICNQTGERPADKQSI